MSNPFVMENKKGYDFKKSVCNDTHILTRKVVMTGKLLKDGDEESVSLKPKVKDEKIKTKDLIDSFKDDVGVYNILEKVKRTGDVSLLGHRGRNTYQDISDLPDNLHDLVKLGEAVQGAKDLPKDLVGNRTIEEFLSSVSLDEIQNFAKRLVDAKLKESEVKGNG